MIDGRSTRPGSSVEARIVTYETGVSVPRFDRLATEEPLEIRVRAGNESRTVAITMRTPGNDFELAAGFLYAEGVIANLAAIAKISYCLDGSVDTDQQYNIVIVELAASVLPALDALERHFTTTSACGVCGRAQLESLASRGIAPIVDDVRVNAALVTSLPERLRGAQGVFEKTGGLHAAGVFALSGELVVIREDVGRHNALDKAVGWALLGGRLPFERNVLLVSGRSSYEILQKAVVARIPIVCAISAPSSLAADLARSFGVTLVGFLRDERFNVYANPDRIGPDTVDGRRF